MKKLCALGMLLCTFSLASCVNSSVRQATQPHWLVVQGGKNVVPSSNGSVEAYSLENGEYSILVPNVDKAGKRYDPAIIPVRICASLTPDIFDQVKLGAFTQDIACLAYGRLASVSVDPVTKSANILVSREYGNFIHATGVPGAPYNRVNIHALMNLKKYNVACIVRRGTNCQKILPILPGSKVYMIVFIDMNNDNKIDAGEYTFMEIDR